MTVSTVFLFVIPPVLLLLSAYFIFRKRHQVLLKDTENKLLENGTHTISEASKKLENHAAHLNPEKVQQFYNENTHRFLQVYGDIIQAYRTNDVTNYLDYTIKSAGLENDQIILDAGCGIAGPARYFASKLDVQIKGCTISDVQVDMAIEKIKAENLSNKIEVRQGDYHTMYEMYGENQFDRILFLESFGHSNNKTKLIEAAWKTLKPGGQLYIKDLFEREASNSTDAERIKEICYEINAGYQYNIANLYDVLKDIRRLGFILNFVKTPEVEIGIFEHLTISNQFQDLFNISKIESWDNYVFPIDFYEIKCQKPAFDLNIDKHLYFMNRKELGAN
ncbi:MAG: class I SAM-dependent methyltransferase [Chitinophagales bacterium]|nr:class I SAM-dependent methyltransferase [Chitinophagales bacterium]